MQNRDDDEHDYGFGRLIRDILKYSAPYKPMFAAAVLLRVASNVISLYPAWALGKITTFFVSYSPGQPLDFFLTLLGLWLVLELCKSVCVQVGQYYETSLCQRIETDVKSTSLKHFITLDLSWHEKEYGGSRTSRLYTGTSAFTRIIQVFFTQFIGAAVNILGVSLILFSLSWELSIAFLFFSVTYYLLSFSFTRRIIAQSRVVQKSRELMSGVTGEPIGSIRTVKMLNLANPLLARIRDSTMNFLGEYLKRSRYYKIRSGLTGAYSITFRIAALAYMGYGIYLGRFEVGMLVMFESYFGRMLSAASDISSITNDVLEQIVDVGRLMSLMELKPTVELSGKLPMKDDWNVINIQNLSFCYEGMPALNNVNLTIKRGQKIGIVGPNGAGKSTLIRLMLKLDETYDGTILIDDTPLREIRRDAYISKVSVVPQNTELFKMSLKENIEIVGGGGNDLRKVIEIADLSGLVSKLPQGVDTTIGERGMKLSGGERQKISIARALYKNPQILFLDELTSQLDANSEFRLQESLRQTLKDITVIVVAHRLSTVTEMERILVMDKGTIVEDGTFNELIQRRGLFHELWEKQRL
ncbi:MAG: ABC transporter ATP-binding protein [Candidatus Altiarchaeota archaeon]